jgi:predicted 3-demethylubiquinone-9 3-methyltransferase (glyoxalase superfamily)
MPKITTFLTFNDQAEAAATFYTGIFPNSSITSISRYGAAGTVMSVNFQLDGQDYIALNGGASFTFADGISLFVSCKNQQEVDEYWTRLSAGGREGQCGWLKDQFGVSWQIVPTQLGQVLGNKDPEKAKKAMQAMLQMGKIDIQALEQAAAS